MGSEKFNDFLKIPNSHAGESEFQKPYDSTLDNIEVGIPSICKDKTAVPKRSLRSPKQANPKKPQLRAVLKDGEYNIHPSRVSRKHLLRDIFTTLVDSRWRWTISVFVTGFIGSWTFFAAAWWLLALVHGDLQENHLPMNQIASNWTPCVTDIYGFASCFLFSVETQHTTGYGEKRPTEKCSDAILLMCVQNIVGLVIEAFLVGIFFAKMTRPKLRTQTIRFSENAVICVREAVLCLVFRIGDMRKKSGIIETRIRAKLIRERTTKEGDLFTNYLSKLTVGVDDCDGDLFLIWPVSVVHKIDEASPLYGLSASDLEKENFEIVVTLEGTVESTDQKTQARSSYLASEILWGRKFDPVIAVDEEKSGYKIDYSKFNDTKAIDDMPLCSAAKLKQLNSEKQGNAR